MASDATGNDRAARLHRDAIVIDGHSDVLKAIADGKMRLGERVELPPDEGWQPPLGWSAGDESALYDFSPHTAYFQTMGYYDLPRFLEGGLTAQAMAIYLDGEHLDRPLHRAMEMVYWLWREAEELRRIRADHPRSRICSGSSEGATAAGS